MSSLVKVADFLIVPKELEQEFVQRVLNEYHETTVLGNSERHLTNELVISDEMVDTFNKVVSFYNPNLDIEDHDPHEIEHLMSDVILVMERFKLSYEIEAWSYEPKNLPFQRVW